LIHALMVSERWALRAAAAHALPGGRIVELGAGDGHLCTALERRGFSVTGCDRIARPRGLPERVAWKAGDIMDTLPGLRGDVAVAVLFLHHFEEAALAAIGHCLRTGFETLVFCEPHRHPLALAEGALLLPFVSRATRHDMMVSLRAGFRPGEMSELLGLRTAEWEWQETTTLLGAIRMIARRMTR
jgi:2-polyprenyl-3-methyl-5-hydroxy-6-metoxy-1,4-benzoquinol methylase